MLEAENQKRDVSQNFCNEAKHQWDIQLAGQKAKEQLAKIKTEIDKEVVFGRAKD
jgi:hypothetical protein